MKHSTEPATSTFQFKHGQEDKMDQTSTNREFVKRHFEAVNRREVQTDVFASVIFLEFATTQ